MNLHKPVDPNNWEAFIKFIAERLVIYARDYEPKVEQDNLQLHINSAFLHRTGKKLSLNKMIGTSKESGTDSLWILDQIERGESAWLVDNVSIPIDLFDAKNAARLIDLQGAIGNEEIRLFGPGSEVSKR